MPAGDDREKKKENELLEFSGITGKGKDERLHDDMDFDDFTKTIDERIDMLFRPSDEIGEVGNGIDEDTYSAKSEAKDGIETVETATVDTVVADTSGYEPVQSGLNLELLQKGPTEKPTEEKRDKPPVSNITNLLEKVHIAYLDLDWEFSQKNVQNLQKSLQELKEVVDLSQEADSLFYIVEAILDMFLKDENAVSYASMSILREALNLLLKILQKPAGADEKALLAGITKRFNKLAGIPVRKEERVKPVTVDEVAKPEKLRKKEISVESVQAEAFPSEVEVRVAEYGVTEVEKPTIVEKTEITEEYIVGEVYDVEGVVSALEKAHLQLQQIYSAIERENKLFGKIINVFSQRPKLRQIADYLTKIENNYSRYGKRLKTLEAIIAESVDVLKRLSVRSVTDREGIEQERIEEISISEEPSAKVVEEIPEEIKKLIVVQVHGQNVALPFENVIKVAGVTSKKIQSISNRGYAKLKDVKPFLRGIKHGVLGKWRTMPSGFLKSLEFPLIDISTIVEEFRDSDSVFYEGVVFIGDDEKYGAILVDAVLPTTPEVLKEYFPVKGKKGILGTGVSETGKEFKILNISEILE